jgi:hypothetical protein
MADQPLDIKNISIGDLNEVKSAPVQEFYISDTDDTLSVGQQLNDKVSIEPYRVVKAVVKKVDIPRTAKESEQKFSFDAIPWFGKSSDTSTAPKKGVAYVYIDVIHHKSKNIITEENVRQLLTKVELYGDATATVVDNIIEISCEGGDYTVGTYLRNLSLEGANVTTNPNTRLTSQFCNVPSAVPKAPAASGNTPTPPTQAGQLPATNPSPTPSAQQPQTGTGVSSTPCGDVGNFAPRESQVPGVPFENVFIRNQNNPRKRRLTTCFVVHISAGATSKKGVVRVLNRKNLSVHFIVDTNGNVTQHTELDVKSVAQGALNSRCISIEVLNKSTRGVPSKRYFPGSQEQMEALYQLMLKVQNLVVSSDGAKIPIRAMEADTNNNFLFGVLPFGLDKQKNGIIAHGSSRQADPSKQHADGRFEVCYCHLRALGSSPQDAYNATIKMSILARKGGKYRLQPILRK